MTRLFRRTGRGKRKNTPKFRCFPRKFSKRGRSRFSRSGVGPLCHTLVQWPITGGNSLLQFVSCFGNGSDVVRLGVLTMLSSKRKLSLIAGLAALSLFAAGVGCTGFFVNQPNSVSVTTGINGTGSTTFTVTAPSGTTKLYATATYNSGSKDVTNSAIWTSNGACATVSKGIVTGVGATSSLQITATLGGVGGAATGTVTGGSSQTLAISSVPSGPTFTSTTTATFSATLNGADVTGNTTWTSSNTSVVTFSGNTATFVAPGNATITASDTTTCASGSDAVTVQ